MKVEKCTKKDDELFVVEEMCGKWAKIEAGVDSCAADNVCPADMFPDIVKVETAASKSGKIYAAANGSPIRNEGEKTADFVTSSGQKRSVKFQLAKVTKVLLSAGKIAKAGFKVDLNLVDPSIVNLRTGGKIGLKYKNGIFIVNLWVDTEKVGQVFTRQGR